MSIESALRRGSILKFILPAFFYLASSTVAVKLLSRADAQDASEITTPQPVRLMPGQALTREAKGGSQDRFEIGLQANDCVRVVLNFVDADLSARITGTDQKPLLEANTSDTPGGSMAISWLAGEAGTYEMEVSPEQGGYPNGPYTVEVTEIHPAAPQDLTSYEAELLFLQGEALHRQGNEASLKSALEKYTGSIDLWRKSHDNRALAEALNKFGEAQFALGQNKESAESLEQALEIAKPLPDKLERAAILQSQGETYNALGDQIKALSVLSEALELRHGQAGASREADTLNDLGAVSDDLGRKTEALNYYNQAVALKRQIGDHGAEAIILNNAALVADDLGEKRSALQSYLGILPLLEHARERGNTLNNIALAYENLGDSQHALEYYKQALTNSREAGDHRQEAQTLRNIAALYIDIGDDDAALDYLKRSLPITQAVADKRGEANTLRHLGELSCKAGRYQEAIATLNQALAGSQAISDSKGETADLLQLGKAYRANGEKAKAIDSLNRAVATGEALGDRSQLASIHNNIGEVYLESSDVEKSLQQFGTARELAMNVGDPDVEATALYGLASSEQQLGREESARAHAEDAIALIESLRTRISDVNLGTTFLASRQKAYQLDISLLMQLNHEHPGAGFDAQALEISERARARSLIDLLNEARANIRKGADPELLERERDLKLKLAAQTDLELRLEKSELTLESAKMLKKAISELLRQYNEIEAQIRERSPRYAALTRPEPLKAKDFQDQVLDSETMLLEYSLGDQRSYGWAVTDTSLTSFELPPRAEIEVLAREVYESVTRRAAQNTAVSAADHAKETKEDHLQAAARLSQIILGPVAQGLAGKRLLVVSEGALQYVPFEALPSPEKLDGTPLIANHEVVTLPSASVVAMLRRAPRKQESLRTVAVLADPVFDALDPRLGKRAESPAKQAENVSRAQSGTDQSESASIDDLRLTRSAAEVGLRGSGSHWPRLLFTRREAASILDLTSSGSGMEALDFKANRAVATGPELGQYQIVHFATHGLLNAEQPELSGLVLSLVDENGKPEDGFLELEDIYNLNLNAELVVLSACETGLGKDIKGEGLVGLTRGFMYAGSPRVVASLWRVDDVATADLMKRFYRAILHEGQRPAAALRQAQVEMWQQKRWHDPYYWAGFTMQGDWR